MKVSELITKLQKAQARYGDIEATIDGDEILDFAVFHADNSSGYQALLSTSPAD